MAAAAAAAVLGGGLLSAGSQLGASLGTAAMQSNTAKETNTQNINFQKSVIDRGESSFTELGLPRAMYWNGNTLGSPNTLIHLGGTNFYESSGINANLPYFSANPYSQLSHYAKPNMKQMNSSQNFVRPNRPEPSVSFNSQTQGVTINGLGGIYAGQNDRVGLGAGRYNAVPPPNLTYNSVGVGTSVSTSTKYAQANLNTDPMKWVRAK